MDSIKIKSVSLRSFKCFEDATIDCQDENSRIAQWTVLLGNNNTGKTNLLKAIADLRPKTIVLKNDSDDSASDSPEEPTSVPAAFLNRNSIKLSDNPTENQSSVTGNLLGYDDHWHYNDRLWSTGKFQPDKPFLIFAYGVTRYPSSTSLSESKSDGCASLFHPDSRLINIEEWLMQLDYAAKNGKVEATRLLGKIRELVCGKIFPEISDFRFESSDEFHNYVLFKTDDGWYRYTQLGFGYQSTLSWIIDLCKRMFDNYPMSDNPLHESAVVLIDEIDLHLHPKWQRDIIPYLSKAFPNIQFIVTTHSPLVVQSLNDVNLYVLTRTEGKVVIEKSPVSNFIGWSVEEILRHTMKMNNDVYSDIYQEYFDLFDRGLDENDRQAVEKAYNALSKILHPYNPARRLLDLQISAFRK